MKNSNFQSVYLLSHYMTGLHSVHFYRHNFESGGSSFENRQKLFKKLKSSGTAWSEVGPISHCGDPSDFWNLVRPQPQGCNEYARRQMSEPTRYAKTFPERRWRIFVKRNFETYKLE